MCHKPSSLSQMKTPTWCNTVQVLFLQTHSTCFGRKRPSSGVFKTSTAATGTCVIVAGQSSHLLHSVASSWSFIWLRNCLLISTEDKLTIFILWSLSYCRWYIFYSISTVKTKQMHQFLKFILFWISTLHVSDGLSVRHQKSKTVHKAAVICQTSSATAC